MPTIDYLQDTKKWLVSGTVRTTSQMTEIPSKRARRKKDDFVLEWFVGASFSSAYALSHDLPDAVWTERAKVERLRLAQERTVRVNTADDEYPDDRLSPLQRVGVTRLLSGDLLLADDQGSGKTVMATVALEQMTDVQKVLLITTKSTLTVWARHIEEWAPSYKPFIYHGTPAQAQKKYDAYLAYEGKKVLLGTHASARTRSNLAPYNHIAGEGTPGPYNEPFDLGIVDEIHKIGVDPRNPTVRAFAQISTNCTTRWGLTGTPVNDKADDLWLVFSFVAPYLFHLRSDFRKRFCMMREQFFGGVKNTGIHPDRRKEFELLRDPYWLRRLKREVIAGLPDALPDEYVYLPMDTKQGALYRKLVKKRVAEIDGNMLIVPETLTLNGVHAMVADGFPIVDEEGDIVGMQGPSSKMDYLLEVAEARNGDPFVIYNPSVKVIDWLETAFQHAGFKVGRITGKESLEHRESYTTAFQAGVLDIMLINDAGAEGITLTAADLLIFMRHSGRVITNRQVGDRIDRYGQTRPAQRVILITPDTVDETRELSLEGKAALIEDVQGDKKREEAWLSGQQ